MKLSNWRRLNKTDFGADDAEFVENLSTPINASMDELYNALDNRLDFVDNINATIVSFNISVDSSGNPQPAVQFKLKDSQTVFQGSLVLNVVGTKDKSLKPVSGLYIDAIQNGQSVIIKNIKGLQANNLYTVTVLAI